MREDWNARWGASNERETGGQGGLMRWVVGNCRRQLERFMEKGVFLLTG